MMNILKVLSLLGIILLIGCKSTQPAKNQTSNDLIEINKDKTNAYRNEYNEEPNYNQEGYGLNHEDPHQQRFSHESIEEVLNVKYLKNLKDKSILPIWIKNKDHLSALRKEALNYAHSMVQLYFTKDCDQYYKMVQPMIKDTEEQGYPLITKEIICEQLNSAVVDPAFTFKDYKNNYHSLLLTPNEYKDLINIQIDPNPTIYEAEFIYDGTFLKKPGFRGNIWDDVFLFKIIKKNGDWQLAVWDLE